MSDALAPVTVEFDGRGQLVSNVSTFAGEHQNFVSFVDFITDVAGRIRKRPGKGAAIGGAAGVQITAIHQYTYTNPTTGAITRWRFRTHGTTIAYYNAGVWTAMGLPIAPTSSTWVFVNANNRCFAVNGADEMIVFDGTSWRVCGQDGPAAAMTYSLGGSYSTGTLTATIGSPTLVGAGTAWDFSGAWNNKYIDINGIRYQIGTVVDATHITLSENFKEATAAGLSYTVWGGVMDWDNGPKYAWAFYNPTTGHCSNIRSASSTTTTVTQITETSQVGRTPQLTIAGSAANTSAYNAGYTQIKIFRTPQNGNVLVAINAVVNNRNDGLAIIFTETTATGTDVALTLFEAPLILNRKPPSGLVAIAYHQNRLWAISRTGVYFSAAPSEVSFGVAEECWPAKFYIAINEPTGLLTIGGRGGSDNLIIQTANADYSIDGLDNTDLFAYALPTRKTGSRQYNATAVEGDLLSFYSDKRLFSYPSTDDYGLPIQDKFDAISSTLLANARIHWFSFQSRNFIVLSVPKASGSAGNDYTYVFDRDRERWYEWNLGFTAFGTVHDPASGTLALWAGDAAGNVYQLLGAGFQDGGANFQPTLTTSLIRPFGSEVKGRLQYLKVYVSDGGSIPTGKMLIEEQTNTAATDGTAVTINFRVADNTSQSAQGRELVWTPTVSDRNVANCFQFQVTLPALAGDYYIDRIVAVFDPDQDGEVPARA